MTEQNFEAALERVRQLVADFQKHEKAYTSPAYSESDVRKDFIDKFWIALGWDVNHEQQTNPYEQEVKVERGVQDKAGRKRADYAFLAPNWRDVRFFVEAKKPSRNIDNADDYFQTIRYGWNAQTPLSILTDFEHFRVLDCRYKPDIEAALSRAVAELKFHYAEYADAEKFRKIYHLFSREAVHAGALEKFAESLPKPAGRAAQRRLFGGSYKSVDESFLQELDELREELARSFKNRNPQLNGEELTEATQRTLDRLVFMRFLEDKLIEPETMVEKLGARGTAWRDFVNESQRLDHIYNGIIFKRHTIIDDSNFTVDERVFSSLRERLAHTNSPYDFNSLPVHILGSIYERFLGKVIVATEKRAKVVDKPEVRKAGGVYYTPEYIVRYIVKETIGKVIAGRTPEEIALMHFADIACGSGSFLLGVYDELLRYHTAYYNRNKTKRAEGLRAGCIENQDGTLRLSLNQKKDILLSNIYGVDLDAQAVEVAQLSLYLKLLEDETTASARGFQLEFRETMLPSLDKNVLHGNSLINWDILDGQLFDSEEERKLHPMGFAQAFPEVMRRGGFDAIVGNPPYIRIQTLQETSPPSVSYFKKNYAAASKGNYDIYVVFIERALQLLNERGRLGYIVPHKFFNAQYGAPLRKHLSEGKHLSHVVHFGDAQVFKGATTYTTLLFADKAARDEMRFVRVKDLSTWQDAQAGDEGMIPSSRITPDEWNFTIGKGAGLFEKLSAMPTKLGDVAARMAQGIRTSANEIYVLDLIDNKGDLIVAHSKQLARNVTLERASVSLFLQGREIKPYEILSSGKVVIMPYDFISTGVKLISEKAYQKLYPNSFEYLRENKSHLKSREKGNFSGSNWFAFGRQQNIDLMLLPKILVPDIADRASFALDVNGEYAFTSGYGITLAESVKESPHYILGLLNSRVLDFCLKSISTTLRGGFFRYFTQFIEQLPIRTINFSDKADRARHDRMVTLVEGMLAAKRQLQQARTDRDRNFYEQKCAALDRQIDDLVYELYELTPAEIEIIEAGGA